MLGRRSTRFWTRGPDPEASWLLSRAYLQKRDKSQAQAALAQAGSYRADNPLEAEPSPYVGEARLREVPPGHLSGFARQPAHPDVLPRSAARPAPSPG